MDIKELKKDYQDYKEAYRSFQNEIEMFAQNLVKEHEVVLHVADIRQRPNKEIKPFKSIEDNIAIHGKYSDCKSLFDIKDVAGIRITCHCEDDLENLSSLLEGELSQKYVNVTRETKGGKENKGKSHPSYRAIHLTCAKEKTQNNKNIFCEIQIRTVMADAWAVQDRKYIYGKNTEGEAQELTTAVSDIMNGCEKLWSLVKKKSMKQDELDISGEIAKILRGAELKLNMHKKSDQDVKSTQAWFAKNKTTAFKGLSNLKISGFMEVEVDFQDFQIKADKKDLYEAANSSTIDTFGWPIGVFLANRTEYAPKVDVDGIHAEISVENRESYDYWAINVNGSFYLLNSLFEDMRKPGHIFFNTRIVRIAEVFLYLRNLYAKFNVPPSSNIRVTITHGGLKGRTISSSARNRFLSREYKISADIDKFPTTITTSIREIENNLDDVVEKITKPFFEMFELFSLNKKVLTEIVTSFTNGIVT